MSFEEVVQSHKDLLRKMAEEGVFTDFQLGVLQRAGVDVKIKEGEKR